MVGHDHPSKRFGHVAEKGREEQHNHGDSSKHGGHQHQQDVASLALSAGCLTFGALDNFTLRPIKRKMSPRAMDIAPTGEGSIAMPNMTPINPRN